MGGTPKINALPEVIFTSSEFLQQLTELHLARNDLTEIPTHPSMTSLKLLDVAGNRIEAIRENIAELVRFGLESIFARMIRSQKDRRAVQCICVN